ncbi:hypothetical protein LC55x_0249 [Lysobacter capsici]|nr:hypothetical protein LC55x_0249 [Lysobacter capsici]
MGFSPGADRDDLHNPIERSRIPSMAPCRSGASRDRAMTTTSQPTL